MQVFSMAVKKRKQKKADIKQPPVTEINEQGWI